MKHLLLARTKTLDWTGEPKPGSNGLWIWNPTKKTLCAKKFALLATSPENKIKMKKIEKKNPGYQNINIWDPRFAIIDRENNVHIVKFVEVINFNKRIVRLHWYDGPAEDNTQQAMPIPVRGVSPSPLAIAPVPATPSPARSSDPPPTMATDTDIPEPPAVAVSDHLQETIDEDEPTVPGEQAMEPQHDPPVLEMTPETIGPVPAESRHLEVVTEPNVADPAVPRNAGRRIGRKRARANQATAPAQQEFEVIDVPDDTNEEAERAASIREFCRLFTNTASRMGIATSQRHDHLNSKNFPLVSWPNLSPFENN